MTVATMLLLSSAVTAAPQGVLLDFTATWCGPCQQMSPVISRLQRQGYPIRRVDVDRERDLARKYDISSIPAFVLVVNGREVNRVVGMTSEGQLKRLLAQIPAASEPPVMTASITTPSRPPTTREEPSKPKFSLPPLFRRRENPEPKPDDWNSADVDIRAKHERDDSPAVDAFDDLALASSTRLRVKDREGVNFASGTVIDSRTGRTLVLTCGHVFRDYDSSSSTIEVDVFRKGQIEKYLGSLVDYDLNSDVGLVAIPTENPLPASPVAGVEKTVRLDDGVTSIGCGGGEPPSRQQLRVTDLNKYLGPDNIECTGVPDRGRSGGGLFDAAGRIIGVCIAADRKENRGLYAGLKAIQQLLDRAELRSLYDDAPHVAATDEETPDFADESERARESLAATTATAAETEPRNPRADDRPRFDADRAADLQRALERSGEAEVICIVRSLDDPQAASRVVIINRASKKFVSYLTEEVRNQPRPTSAKVRYRQAEHDGGTHTNPPPSTASSARRSDATTAPRKIERYRRSPASR